MSIQSNFQENNPILKFMNPTTEQHKFSYTNMLSDTCYLSSDTPSPIENAHNFIDPIYVDIHNQKNLLNRQDILMNLHRPIQNYNSHQNQFSQDNSNLLFKYSHSPSSPLSLKNEYTEKKPAARSRGRHVSNIQDTSIRMFTCKREDCGKVFKRSEHLKRHTRSIHTLEKQFECPYQNCHKRFSRSDNLNQHIRIHRHTANKESSGKKTARCKQYNNNFDNNISHGAYSKFI